MEDGGEGKKGGWRKTSSAAAVGDEKGGAAASAVPWRARESKAGGMVRPRLSRIRETRESRTSNDTERGMMPRLSRDGEWEI